MMIRLLLTAALILPVFAQASTFVGNGGNAGDIELQVTLNQIKNTLRSIRDEEDLNELKLCTCYERYSERAACSNLKNLNTQQVQFCADTLKSKIPALLNLLETSPSIKYTWTSEPIQVKEKGGFRAADAVAHAPTKTLTLNQGKFIAATTSQRIFLITHELLHFIPYQNENFVDDVAYPNFPGLNGGRDFINAMASSVAIESYDYSYEGKIVAPLYRSQSIKTHWLSGAIIGTRTDVEQESIYSSDTLIGGTVGYRYQTGAIGYLADLSMQAKKHTEFDTIKVEESRTTFGLGLSYRWFPAYEPMTFIGQSHFLFSLRAEHMLAKLKADDGTPGLGAIEETTSSSSWAVEGNYWVPLSRGVWVYALIKYSAHQPTYQKFDLNYKNTNFNYGVGVSYAY